MTTCLNCGKVAGGHSSILQGCVCQYSMQAPPQPERPAPCAKHCEATAFQITIKNLEAQLAQLKPLTDEDIKKLWVSNRAAIPRYLCFARAIEAKLKERNT